jgi:asparagine synthase (glutamine-hydrolysing)
LINNNHYSCTGPNYLNSVLQKSIKNGLSTLLRYDDRNSMGNSIESRVPFLTREFTEFILSLPENFLINEKGGSKIVFREAMRGIVPDLILDRKEKIGFESPDFKILNKNKDYIINEIHDSKAYEHIQKASALDFIKLSLNNKSNYSSLTWRLINFIIWNNKRK